MAKVFAVLLTDEGQSELEPVLQPYWSESPVGRHLCCREASPDRNFFHVIAESTKSDGTKLEAEIYIPHRFIKIVVATADHKHVGFI
jgi:hypothetical protein